MESFASSGLQRLHFRDKPSRDSLKRWICQICNQSFINKFCGELKTFIRDSTLCETCKLTNQTIIITNDILPKLSSSFESSSVASSASFVSSAAPAKKYRKKKSSEPMYEPALLESFQELFGSGKELYNKIVIQCSDITSSFNDYYIRTSLEELSRLIKKIQSKEIDKIKRVFASCLREILQYDKATLRLHCRTNSKEWKYWCSDVVIYFICRKILFNKPIPICEKTP